MNEDWKDSFSSENTDNAQEATKETESSRVESSVEYGPAGKARSAPRPRGDALRAIFLSLTLVILLFSFFFVGGMLLRRGDDAPTDQSGTALPHGQGNTVIMQVTDETAATFDGDISAVVEKCADAVVEIITTTNRPAYGDVQSGAGSGVIIGIDSDGNGTYIVTNNHVIEGNVSSVIVRTTDGEELLAEIVGADWVSDIAVLRIQKTGLKSAVWASSEQLKLGQSIIAIGNPLGSLGGSVSRGIISGVERTIRVEGVPMKLIQIDAAINPGNSGGGLFDMNGNLIGIVNAKSVATNVEGIGFAIPADYAKTIVVSLAEKGYVDGRVDLGLSLGNATAYGVLVTESHYTDEIAVGDYLYSLKRAEGTAVQITSLDRYRAFLYALKEGETITATVCHVQGSGLFGVTYTTYEVELVARTVK